MPLLNFIHTFITSDVSDRKFGDTIVKQRARFKKMLIEQDLVTGRLSITITVITDQYGNEAGNYGILINGNGLSHYEIELHANNDSAVDPNTGQVLFNRNEGELYDAWIERLGTTPTTVMLQGDFYESIMKHLPVNISDDILGNIVSANSAAYNKFIN